jgi:hypothetical protein
MVNVLHGSIVRDAGGVNNEKVGPFVAAVDDNARWQVLEIARDALRE